MCHGEKRERDRVAVKRVYRVSVTASVSRELGPWGQCRNSFSIKIVNFGRFRGFSGVSRGFVGGFRCF